ncbi:MAG: M15 family metallopeptidase [Clostridia bacterium]|nr:M15 family metallopeptidase [Clostridia bacterium]
MAAAGCAESLPAPAYQLPDGFCYVHDVIEDVVLDIRYAGEHNFVGKPIDGYLTPYAVMTVEAADALKNAADTFREMGYRLKIFDAYRPQSAVKHFVRWSQDADDMKMQAEFYPEYKTKSRIVDEGYIARNSSHMRGSAVDLTLVDMDGNELDMGTCFDYFGKRSWHGAKGLTQEQEENRELLKKVMEANGFRPFEQEWWHYRLKNEPFKTEKFDFPVQ